MEVVPRQPGKVFAVGHDGHRGWVYYVAVHPSRRGQGLGRELMAGAERWVAGRGIPKMQLMVRSTNTGTREFYEERAAITRRLIERHGFTIVAVEADWPDAASIDRYIRHRPRRVGAEPPFAFFEADKRLRHHDVGEITHANRFGFSPPAARPAAKVTACCSAMPTS